jgi:hypothetical protein
MVLSRTQRYEERRREENHGGKKERKLKRDVRYTDLPVEAPYNNEVRWVVK